MPSRGECGAAVAVYLDAAIAELFHGGRTDVAVVVATVVGVVAATVAVVVVVAAVEFGFFPFCRKLRVRGVFRTRTGAIVSLACCRLADKRGGFGGGTTTPAAAAVAGGVVVVMGQLLEFSEPLSEMVSELMLFLRCDLDALGAGFVDLLVPQACALPVQPR